MTKEEITNISIADYEAWISWKQQKEIPGYCIVRVESAEPGYCGTVDVKWRLIDNIGFEFPVIKTNYSNINLKDEAFLMFKQIFQFKLKSFKKFRAA